MMTPTRALAALLATAVATPAIAQYQYGPPPAPAPPPEAAAAQPQVPQNQPKPSKEAAKAIAELMQAVNSKDAASIAAKVAAAQAVAKTRDDHYFIAQLRLKAALAAKDSTATIAAITAAESFAASAALSRSWAMK